jgi:hypothetical protein
MTSSSQRYLHNRAKHRYNESIRAHCHHYRYGDRPFVAAPTATPLTPSLPLLLCPPCGKNSGCVSDTTVGALCGVFGMLGLGVITSLCWRICLFV